MTAYKSVYGIPAYYASPTTPFVLDHKSIFGTPIAHSYFSVAYPSAFQSATMLPGSIRTLPNGARYDVSQGYDAPCQMGDIPIFVRVAVGNNSDLANEMKSISTFFTLFQNDIGAIGTLFVAQPNNAANALYKIQCRLSSFSSQWVDGHGMGINEVNMLLAPIEDEWTFTSSLS